MQESKTREKVLKKIRQALLHRAPEPFPNLDFDSPPFRPGEEAEVVFARRFNDAGGRFVFCESPADIDRSLHDLVRDEGWSSVIYDPRARTTPPPVDPTGTPYDAVVTTCEALVAEDGSLLLSTPPQAAGPWHRQAPAVVVVAPVSRVVPTLQEALRVVRDRYRAHQPAAVAVLRPGEAASGPIELFLLLVDDQDQE